MDELKDFAEQIKIELEERGYDIYLGQTANYIPCIIVNDIVFLYFLKNRVNFIKLFKSHDLASENVGQFEYYDPEFPENMYEKIRTGIKTPGKTDI